MPGPSRRRDLDAERILRALARAEVDFVVVGGIAAVLHGSARNTFDLDICLNTNPENLVALGEVLMGLHARLRGRDEDVPFVPDARTLQRTEILTLTTDAGDLDVLARPVGFGSYDRLRDGADVFEIGDSAVRVAAIPDLLAMKRAAGREKDRDDVATLEAILRLRGPGA